MEEQRWRRFFPFGRAWISTFTVMHPGMKLLKLIKAYNDLKKSKNKDRPEHHVDEIFMGDLQEIFDFADSSSLQWADVKDDDREFLWSQREDRGESSMDEINLTVKKVEKQIKCETLLKWLQECEDNDVARLPERAAIPSPAVAATAVVLVTSSLTHGSQSLRKQFNRHTSS